MVLADLPMVIRKFPLLLVDQAVPADRADIHVVQAEVAPVVGIFLFLPVEQLQLARAEAFFPMAVTVAPTEQETAAAAVAVRVDQSSCSQILLSPITELFQLRVEQVAHL